MNRLIQLFLLFMIYSIIGWLIEIIPKSIRAKRFINRGFLIGPYLPVYGSGSVIMTVCLNDISSNPIILFILSLIICSILEYITSYIMEKMFKARWWDYSTKPLNLNGRIWIGNAILFGLGGVAVIKFINPIIFKYINQINENTLSIITIILFIIFIIDLIISYNVINNFKKELVFKLEDSSEKMANKVKNILNNKIKEETSTIQNKLTDLYKQITKEIKKAFGMRTMLYRRLVNAFPNLEISKDTIKKSIEDISSKFKGKIKM